MAHQLRPSHLNRYRQISGTLSRHGMGYFAAVSGLENIVGRIGRLFRGGRDKHVHTRPEAIRNVVEDLGTTFVKLGQMVSTRPDLIGPEMQSQLQGLQDNVSPLSADVVKEVIFKECGRTADDVFAEFDDEPLGSASVGQAHLATLKDGTEVVVKVRRPGVVQQVHIDLEILGSMARNAGRLGVTGDEYDLVGMVSEFGSHLQRELDYRMEMRNADRLRANFEDEPRLIIPKVYPDLTTEQAIVMERVRGMSIRDIEAIDAAGIDRSELAERAAGYIFKMIFEDGFYHADLHPGNIFIQPDGSIALIDFGLVGTIDEVLRELLVDLILAASTGDSDRLTDAVLTLVVRQGPVDRNALRREISALMSRYRGMSLAEIPVTDLMNEVLDIARQHKLRLPSDFVTFIKTSIMVEGMGETLDPDFNLGQVLRPYGERLVKMRLSPRRQFSRLAQGGFDALQLGAELPRRMRRILDDLEEGRTTINMKPAEFEPLVDRIEGIANRLIAGVIVASLIAGLAILSAAFEPSFVADNINSILVGVTAAGGFAAFYLGWRFLRRTS